MSDGTERQYQVKELAELSGVSVRTLHYYEEIGLLAPDRTDAGYRVYDETDVRQLQEVLAMRACAMPLGEIRELLASSDDDAKSALMGHSNVCKRRSVTWRGLSPKPVEPSR